ncbi:RDD family protein [Frondihabitans cladoniiphilus]|uniref:RDD family protein n=1 Tax=Frondihabitans cladoniiphilus TaxID=715785 RepID=A0ABP8VMX3_9MICO
MPARPPYIPPEPKKGTPYPGYDLGLPEKGPRSLGRLGRRVLGLAIDWLIAVIISAAFFHYGGLATLIVFAVVQIVFLITLGGTPGHLILRMRVTPLAGGRLGWWRPIVRTVLICIVIPAVIYDQDQRGLHDRAVGTILVRV